MNLKIGENIRMHRRDMGLSQEKLAERLGVSFQAVSKWERNETYPDITFLPVIANFFHVSVDSLLGAEEIREAEEVKAIVAKCYEYDTHYEGDKLIDTIGEGLKRFPNNYELLSWYAYAIQNKDPEKCVDTCKYILDSCTDQGIRNWVQSNLCYGYFKIGDREKAIECAKQLPNYYNTSEDALRHFLDGHELKQHIQDNIIIKLAYEFWLSIRKLQEFYSPAEQIELFKKSNMLYDVIYETADIPFKFTRKMRNYQGMAEVCLKSEKNDEAFGYMRKAAECATEHDKLPRVINSDALLFNCHSYDRSWESKADLKLCDELLHDFETEDEYYAKIRETAEYKEIINMLKA